MENAFERAFQFIALDRLAIALAAFRRAEVVGVFLRLALRPAGRKRLAQPFVKDLSKLDGAFELFRPAWTTPARRDRILVSRLLFTTGGGFTHFREEQDYTDPGYHNAVVKETEEGAVFFTAANIVLFGFGLNAERVKLFIVHSWHDALNGPLPVTHLSGIMIGVSGRRQEQGYPFVAIRSQKPLAKIETGIIEPPDPRLDPEMLKTLGIQPKM